MNKFFRRLPLLAKLMLIGLIPFCFLVFLTVEVYEEKTEKLSLFDNYKIYLEESADINALINALQEERKYSFDYAMTKKMRQELVLQRPRTDALIQKLMKSGDSSLVGFTGYTKLKDLPDVRNKVDSFKIQPNQVMHLYSNTVFRLNTLNTIPPANTAYLQPVYKDLMAQKILSEMSTYMGIIRSNIYNVLHTRLYMIETLMGTIGAHDVYKSYEAELLVKATPEISDQYKSIRSISALKPTTSYIDTLFTRFAFDSSYTASEWWQVSEAGVKELRSLQENIWNGLFKKLNGLYKKELNARNRTLIFLIIALVSVIIIVTYIVFIISRTLRKLRLAAEKLANGETGVDVSTESADAVGSLAKSISKIDKNNQSLAAAAMAMGQGNFDVQVKPRSPEDILGNAIVKMKKELQQYSQKMEQLVGQRTEELARSNEDLQQFAHVASHDLKEPLRKITTFSNILNEEQGDVLSDKGKLFLHKIEHASRRMSDMIEGILAYSTVAVNEQSFKTVDLNKIMEGVQNDLELAIIQKEAQIIYEKLPYVSGIPLLLHQLFYNLVSNALKFSKTDLSPIIRVTSETTEIPDELNGHSDKKPLTYNHIIISDNGIGFNQLYTDRMFSVFSRLNPKDKYEGTGLGLALCRKIVQRHKGKIYAEGEEGKGATFHVLLPKK